jgi:hypothetical protein
MEPQGRRTPPRSHERHHSFEPGWLAGAIADSPRNVPPVRDGLIFSTERRRLARSCFRFSPQQPILGSLYWHRVVAGDALSRASPQRHRLITGRTRGRPVSRPPARSPCDCLRRRLLIAVGAAAVLLRLVQQIDLLFQQLVLELFTVKLELDLAIERRLTDVALVEAALDDHAGGR